VNSTLEEVWNGHAAYKFRKRMMRHDFRDCLPACDLNTNPLHPRAAEARKAMWIIRRDPRSAYKKALRKLGITSAQLEMPDHYKDPDSNSLPVLQDSKHS
jgi:hypothetical protein